MINHKQLFNSVNADDDPRFLGTDQCLNLENVRAVAYGEGQEFNLEGVPSTTLKYYYYPPGTVLTIGRCVDYTRLYLIWAVYNSTGDHGIYAYDIENDFTYLVLLSSQTEEGLNFSKNYRIDRNMRVIGDLLFWTDNNNEPRCINYIRGIKLNNPSYVTDLDPYTTPLDYNDLTIIKRPPEYRLQVSKITDPSFQSNFIQTNAYQFYYRYWYKDYQYSVLSVFSQLIPYNGSTDTYNAVNIKMPFTENIPDEVQQVDICVKYGNTGKSFIIRSYNKSNYYDNVAISDHNANITQLGFTFYDNIAGIAIDDVTAATSFDDVALKAKTLELARNRLFMGNVLKGYNTPSRSSLTISYGTYNTGGAGTYVCAWKYFYLTAQQNSGTGTTTQQFFYAYNASLPTTSTSYYYSAYQSSTPPGIINASDATTNWATETELASWVQRNVAAPSGYHWINGPYTFYDTALTVDLIFTVDLSGLQFFKSSSLYNVAITFYDRYRRKCGYAPSVQINIPDRTFDQTVFASTINWVVNNTNALTEIPDWAYYYMVNVSLNETTRFFEQIWIVDTNYVVKNQDGTYTYGTTYSTTTYANAFNISPLNRYGLGYTFTDGDYARVYFSDGTNKIYSVLGQDGNFVFLQPDDIGALGAGVSYLIELYTPYKKSSTEPLYETGDMIPISNPATSLRQYSITSGTINGDCYAIERDKGTTGTQLYFVEAMSPNDKVWQNWEVDRGWTNFIDTIGQQQKTTSIDYSDTYISGTKINGYNKFEPLNTKDIGNSSGSIQKLQLTNKMQEAGNVMLVITTDLALSAYLEEVQIYTAAQATNLITSDNIIGTINAMKNNRGTLNPESVVEYNGSVWWFDAVHGAIAQYDENGIVDVSLFKMRRFWDKYGKRYIEQGDATIEALCGFSYIDSCVDPSTGEVLFTLPQTETNTVTSGIPVGYAPALPSYSTLPDYASSIQNRFDIYDGQPKMMIYKFEKNKWFGAYLWLPDCQEYVGNKLYSWKNGYLYLHNENTASFNTIYGVQYPQRMCFCANGLMPSVIKDVMDIAVEGEMIPNYAVCYSDYPNVQITDLADTDVNPDGSLAWQNLEGVQYRTWLRDRLSPQVGGGVIAAMYGGDPIKSATPFIMLEFQEYTSKLLLNFADIGFNSSRGHLQILTTKTN